MGEKVDPNSKEYRKALRKPDIRILVWYSFMYLVVQMNKNNVSNSAIMNLEAGHGIKKQLGNLTSQQWAWVLSCFYYPYLFFEPPFTVLMKKFSPSIWQARLMISWGIVSMSQAAAKNYTGIIIARVFLGFCEAGFYPTVLYHLSFWYRTEDLRIRVGLFYATGQLAGFISGLLAYGISFLDQKRGISGWRWLFILEGVIPILGGLYTLFFLPDYPGNAKMLTPRERELILGALPSNSPKSSAKTFDKKEIKKLLKSPSFYTYSLLWVAHGIGGWGITFVLPTIISELGFTDTAKTQLMTMPPAILSFIIMAIIGYLGTSRGNNRSAKKINMFFAAAANEFLIAACYIVLLVSHHKVVQYIMVFLADGLACCTYPLLWPDRMRIAGGTSSAGFAIGWTNCMAQFLGIVGPQIYQSKYGPTYRVSYGASLGLCTFSAVFILITWFITRDDFKKLDEQDAEEWEQSSSSSSVVVETTYVSPTEKEKNIDY